MLKTKTIKTDKATLLVVECPKTYSLFHDDEWNLIGRLPDITEEDAKLIVDEYDDYGVTLYQNYATTSMRYFDEQITAIDSLHSLLQANEIYFENPIPPFIERLEDFKEAQSKVWDKERTYLFKKI